MDNKPSMIKAAAIGGGAAGILSAIPVVNWLNCVCCAYLIGGGILAAYLYSREVEAVGGSFTVGSGGLLGLVTAAFYSVIGSIAGFIVNSLMGVSLAETVEGIRDQMDSQGNLPPETMEQFEAVATFLGEAGTPILMLLGFGMSLLLGAVFCTIGGLIGGAVFKKEAPESAAPTEPTEPTPGT